jgi:hypothetical protein
MNSKCDLASMVVAFATQLLNQAGFVDSILSFATLKTRGSLVSFPFL